MLEVKEEEEEEEESRRRPLLRRLRTRLHCWAKASRMRRFSAAEGGKINRSVTVNVNSLQVRINTGDHRLIHFRFTVHS